MSFKKNIAYNTILTVLNVAFPIITTPYVSRVLGVNNIGIVNFATIYASYFVLFAALGIPLYGTREIARSSNNLQNSNKIFSEIFAINCISTIIFLFVYIISIFYIPILQQAKTFLLLSGVFILFVPLNVDWFFAGREQFKMITIRSILAKLLSILCLFIFVRTRNDTIAYLIVTISANLLSQFWNFGYLLRHGVKLEFSQLNLRKHLNPILILFISSVATSAYTMLGPLLLGLMSDYIQVGYYTSATKISRLILPIVTTMSLVVIARINSIKNTSEYIGETTKLLSRSFDYMILLAAPATVGLIVIAPRFVPWFFGAEFIGSTVTLQVLSLLILIIGLSNLFGTQVLVAAGHEKKYLKAVVLGITSNIILNLLFIDKYGAYGASLASVISEILVVVLAYLLARKVAPINISAKSIYQPLLASCFIIIISEISNYIIDDDLLYLFVTGVTSTVFYTFIMIVIFKHTLANQMFKTIISKARNLV